MTTLFILLLHVHSKGREVFFSILTIIAFLGMLYLIVRCIKKTIRLFREQEKKKGILWLILIIYLCASAWKLTYYFNPLPKTIEPELIAEFDGDTHGEHFPEFYFLVNRFPFTLSGTYTDVNGPAHSCSKDIDVSVLKKYVDYNEPYTYIVSYGVKIEKITVNCWDGKETLPAPWNGNVMFPEMEGTQEDNKVYIYRFPLAPVSVE